MSNPGDVLSRLCSGAQNLVLAAPYIKADALTRILAGANPSASLICITRWHPNDIAVGASDTECRKIVTERGGSFRLHASLHAKYYQIDDAILVGSANLTSTALGWSPQSNLEILCHAGDEFALAFQQELLTNAREISDNEFARWEAITRIDTPNHLAITSDGQPPLETWRPATRDPRHVELVYGGREEEIASSDERRAARRDIQALMIPPGLTDEQVRNLGIGLPARRAFFKHCDPVAEHRDANHLPLARRYLWPRHYRGAERHGNGPELARVPHLGNGTQGVLIWRNQASLGHVRAKSIEISRQSCDLPSPSLPTPGCTFHHPRGPRGEDSRGKVGKGWHACVSAIIRTALPPQPVSATPRPVSPMMADVVACAYRCRRTMAIRRCWFV